MKRLGYNRLCIDSPCILQDSNDVWPNQIPVICAIYRNSILTITAFKG